MTEQMQHLIKAYHKDGGKHKQGSGRWSVVLAGLATVAVLFLLLQRQQQSSAAVMMPGQQTSARAVKVTGPLLTDYPHITQEVTPLDCDTLLASGKISKALFYREPGAQHFLTLHPQTYNMLSASVNTTWVRKTTGEVTECHLRSNVHNALRYFFSRGCGSLSAPQLVVDVGGNVGFYTLLAATHGCQVLTFDPQEICNYVERNNLCLNKHNYPAIQNGWVNLINRPVAAGEPVAVNMSQPPGCNGAFSVAAASGSGSKAALYKRYVVKQTIDLDSLLLKTPLEVYVLKLDAEGFEHHVLNSMKGMFEQRRVRNIFVELTPQFMRRDGVSRKEVFVPFQLLLAQQCKVYPIAGIHGDWDNLDKADEVFETEESFWEYFKSFQKQTDFYISCPK